MFGRDILNKVRRQALKAFRLHALSALKELEREAHHGDAKALYRAMADNVRHTPIYFYPRHALQQTVTPEGFVVAETKGEHVNYITLMQRGKEKFVLKSHYMNLPVHHIFDRDKISPDGLMTLCHEYAHFPKKAAMKFAAGTPLNTEQAEELFADMLAAKLMVKMGFSKHNVLHRFRGRGLVYKGFPYEQFLHKVIHA